MPVSRNSPTPIVHEANPSNAASYEESPSTSSPLAPPSPKSVHFATPSSGFERSTRPTNNAEEWSVWKFEDHASRCSRCEDPVATHRRGHSLCETGHELATKVSLYFHDHAGRVYSRQLDDKEQPVHVELNPGYVRTRRLLKYLASSSSSASRSSRHRTVPIVSYPDEHLSVPRRAEHNHKSNSSSTRYVFDDAIVEPSHSSSHNHHHHHHHHHHSSSNKSKHRGSRYRTVVVSDGFEDRIIADDDRRGSLYEKDMRRSQRDKGYRVEDRLPTRQEFWGR